MSPHAAASVSSVTASETTVASFGLDSTEASAAITFFVIGRCSFSVKGSSGSPRQSSTRATSSATAGTGERRRSLSACRAASMRCSAGSVGNSPPMRSWRSLRARERNCRRNTSRVMPFSSRDILIMSALLRSCASIAFQSSSTYSSVLSPMRRRTSSSVIFPMEES